MLRRTVIVYAIYLMVSARSISAQDTSFLTDPCGCNAGLKDLKITLQTDYKLQYAYLRQIDEQQYNELKKSADTNASYYELIKGTGNFSEFEGRRNTYLESVGFSMTAADSLNYVVSMTPTADWSECKRACISSGSEDSFLCGVTHVTTEQVAATCSWKAVGVQSARTISVQVNGISLPPKLEIPPNTTRDKVIPRGTVDQLITFTLKNGPSRTVTVARVPTVATTTATPPPVVKHVLSLSSSGTWVVPPGIVYAQVTVKIYGAGGGGGGGGGGFRDFGNRLGSGGGAGGNAGEFVEVAVPTSGLSAIQYIIGSGGSGGSGGVGQSDGSTGQPGGPTRFLQVEARGGAGGGGGKFQSAGGTPGAVGGAGAGGGSIEANGGLDGQFRPRSGNSGLGGIGGGRSNNFGGGGGGGGAGSAIGNGGDGQNGQNCETNAYVPTASKGGAAAGGGGGGGARANNGNAGGAGGPGGDGLILLEYRSVQ